MHEITIYVCNNKLLRKLVANMKCKTHLSMNKVFGDKISEFKYNPEFWQDQKQSTENEIIEKYETGVKATGLKNGLKNKLDARLKRMALKISRVY